MKNNNTLDAEAAKLRQHYRVIARDKDEPLSAETWEGEAESVEEAVQLSGIHPDDVTAVEEDSKGQD